MQPPLWPPLRSAALLGQLVVLTLVILIQLYLSAVARANNAAFLRGAVISQAMITALRPGLGLSWSAVGLLLGLTLGFGVYHRFRGSTNEPNAP